MQLEREREHHGDIRVENTGNHEKNREKRHAYSNSYVSVQAVFFFKWLHTKKEGNQLQFITNVIARGWRGEGGGEHPANQFVHGEVSGE